MFKLTAVNLKILFDDRKIFICSIDNYEDFSLSNIKLPKM